MVRLAAIFQPHSLKTLKDYPKLANNHSNGFYSIP